MLSQPLLHLLVFLEVQHVLSLVDAKPSNARDRGSDHTDICRHADELATLLPATKLLQPPSAAEAAKPCGRARVSGCQLQWRSQGGF